MYFYITVNEFLTLKSKSVQSSVHHQSITQRPHSFITNLVPCSFRLHSECLHFGTSFTTHILPKTLSWLCEISAFHPVLLHLQSQMRFLSQIRSINPVSTYSCCETISPPSLKSVSELFIMSPSHNPFNPSSQILLSAIVL